MAADALYHLPSEVLDNMKFDKDLLEQHDKRIGMVVEEVKDTGNGTPHTDKPAIPDLQRKQHVDQVCQKLSKPVKSLSYQYRLDQIVVLIEQTELDRALK